MKRFLIAALAIASALGLSLPASAQTVLHFSHNATADDTINLAALRLAETVSERTNGELQIKVHPNSSLAGLRDGVEGVRLGTIDMTGADSGTLGNWVPGVGIFSLPFVFDDFEHAVKVMDGPVGEWKAKELKEKMGVELLGQSPSGFRVILTTDKMVNSAEDLRGMKIRIPEIPVYVATFRALHVNATPIPWADVYTALQSGVVEGVEAPPSALYLIKHHEVTDFVAPTNHILLEQNFIINSNKMASLPPEQQEIIREAATEAVNWLREQRRTIEADYLEKLKEDLTISDNFDAESFRENMQPVWEEFTGKTGTEEILKMIRDASES